ncbi:MAG: phosphopantetheine-binding protein, partial [Bacteroidetes bacterium]|nr:phosphopantetheine-binding protein [Bacteroidota bacterium]
VLLEEMPLNLSDKVDERRLLELYTSRDRTTEKEQYTPPNSETEIILERIIRQLLNLERVSTHDDFFKLGGHSLLMIKAVSMIRKELSLNLPISALFEHRTVASLSRYIEVITMAAKKQGEDTIEIDF